MGKSWQETGSRSNRRWPFPCSWPADFWKPTPVRLSHEAVFKLRGMICSAVQVACAWGSTLPFKRVGFVRKGKTLYTRALRGGWGSKQMEKRKERQHIHKQPLWIKCLHYFTEIAQQPQEFQMKAHDLENLNNWPSHTTGKQNQLQFIWPQGPYLYYNICCFHRHVAKTSLLSLLT